MDAALGGGNTHALALSTGTVGNVSGRIAVQSDSQAAANRVFAQDVSFAVLNHARPLFRGEGEALSLTLDFGTVEPGSTSEPRFFSLGNWNSDLGFTAGLDFDRFTPSGTAEAFRLNLTTFAALAPGAHLDFSVVFEPMRAGSFEARYDLFFSDENLPGATELRTLQLHLIGTAVPEPSAVALLTVAALGAATTRMRRVGCVSHR
jgi:hypothetical protein